MVHAQSSSSLLMLVQTANCLVKKASNRYAQLPMTVLLKRQHKRYHITADASIYSHRRLGRPWDITDVKGAAMKFNTAHACG